MKIPVEVSARHVHLTEAHFHQLFGADAALTLKKALSQPGEFLSHARVTVGGSKRNFENVAVLGPFRAASQAELSLTDLRSMGLTAPIRESGDLAGSAPLTLIGPAGTVELPEGLIAAKRHIHMTPEDAAKFGTANKQIVHVRVAGDRPLIFGDVVVRVAPTYALAMHIDTDEGNAAAAPLDGTAEIVHL